MKRSILSILLLLLTVGVNAQVKSGQNLGTKTLYYPQQQQYTVVPAGYKPVYVNLLSRHGSRHLTKAPSVSTAWKLIHKADSLRELTTTGLALKAKLVKLQQVESKYLESISVIGGKELEAIAKRLYQKNGNIFKSESTKLLVSTTRKGRTKESAEAFLAGLKLQKPSLLNDVKFNYADDDKLRFFDFSKTYLDFKENGSWLSVYNQLSNRQKFNALASAFSAKFFKSGFLSELSAEDKVDFIEDIYGFYTILPAIKAEIEREGFTTASLYLSTFFTSNELANLRLLGNADDFLKKGPGTNNNGIQVKIAAPLLVDFINAGDLFVKSGTYAADLRFAHAETIAPFAAIMDIKGASTPANDIFNFEKVWKAENVIPFSANIQWIFYRDAKNNYLVKFLLNEKEVGINGLSTKTYPYYNWQNVRRFYVQKLSKLHLSLDGDLHQYLLDVK